MKSAKVLSALIRQEPARADWWIRMEAEARPSKPAGALFRKDRPNYRQLKEAVLAQRDLDFGAADALADCFCHD